MELPDIIGFCLEDALELIQAAGFDVAEVQITTSPNSNTKEYDEHSRVVRIEKREGNKLALLVCNMQCSPCSDNGY